MKREDQLEAQTIAGAYAEERISREEAMRALQALGLTEAEAKEMLFVAGGGSDVLGADEPDTDWEEEE